MYFSMIVTVKVDEVVQAMLQALCMLREVDCIKFEAVLGFILTFSLS